MKNAKAVSQESESTSDVCPICGGCGYIIRVDPETGERFSRECQCEKRRQNLARIERSGLSSVLNRYTFEKYRVTDGWQKTALEAAKRYADGKGGEWFFAGGQSGAGKTHLCTAICGVLMNRGIPVIYMQWRSDVPGLKAKINDEEEYTRAMRRLKHVRCLYIDDFLKGGITDADKNIAYDLLNYRYNNPGKMTIISTEMPIQKILEWDEAIGGRIVERCEGNIINIKNGKNWRLCNKKE